MSTLALLGGEKTHNKNYKEYAVPKVPEKAYKMVEEMMRKEQISSAPIVKEFEEKFAEYLNARYVLTENSCTSSIHGALFAIGVRPGDEVIVPSFTFWAGVGPVVGIGATPVFADIDPDTFCLTAETIRKCITPKTKAMIIVHVYGVPCEMDEISALAKERNIKIIEDCAHAHGASYGGKKIGTHGDICCFSLQGEKLLTGGEGGVLVTNCEEYYERAASLGQYMLLWKFPDTSPYKKYKQTGFGFKHRPHPLGIAIAMAGLEELDTLNEIRNENAFYLEKLISDIDFIAPQKVPEKAERVFSYHFMKYIPENFGGISKQVFHEAMGAEGLYHGYCGYGNLHKEPFYSEHSEEIGFSKEAAENYKPPHLPVTEYTREHLFMVAPRFERATKEDIENYAKALHKIAKAKNELMEYDKTHAKKEIELTSRTVNRG